MKDHELKLMDLATQCGVLIVADEIAQVFGAKKSEEMVIEAREKATALAHELFPAMAKPLVWARSRFLYAGNYFIDQKGTRFIAHFNLCVPFDGNFDTEEAAQAVCEADHQARFLEQCA